MRSLDFSKWMLRIAIAIGATLCVLANGLHVTQGQAATLALFQTVSGHADQSAQTWTFSARKGQTIGVRVAIASGNLSALLDCSDATHQALAHGAVTAKSTTLDGIAIPADGTYTLTLKADNNTAGDFALTLLPGYSTLLMNDSMNGANHWQLWQQTQLTAQIADSKLRLQYTAANRFTWTTAEQIGALADGYLQADVRIERQSVYTEYGLLMRGVTQADGLTFYAFMLNSDGKYRFGLSTPAQFKVLQDWTPMGLPLTTNAVIGVLAQGDHFSLFYNGVPLATLTDSTLASGQIGLLIGTGAGDPTTASVLYSSVVLTAPHDTKAITLPAALADWQRAPERIVAELQAAGSIHGVDKRSYGLTQTVVRNYAVGLVMQPLAKVADLQDLLIIADISSDTTQSGVACGVALRYTNDKTFTMIYIDRKGGYGLYQTSGGHGVLARYDLSKDIKTANLSVNRLIIVAEQTLIAVYINGKLIDRSDGQLASGQLGLAIYNYQVASARCEFDNVSVQMLTAG